MTRKTKSYSVRYFSEMTGTHALAGDFSTLTDAYDSMTTLRRSLLHWGFAKAAASVYVDET